MKPYSKDLRLRVLAAFDAGRPREEVAKTFSVSVPTIKRWLKRRRETGDVEPKLAKHFDVRRLVFIDESGFSSLHDALEGQGSQRAEGSRQGGGARRARGAQDR